LKEQFVRGGMMETKRTVAELLNLCFAKKPTGGKPSLTEWYVQHHNDCLVDAYEMKDYLSTISDMLDDFTKKGVQKYIAQLRKEFSGGEKHE
jgi:hypothetical protein